ncbi:MAG: RsmF rRNA methyltransferase first C-terminal domain-containing protein [Clostridia bacterium]|nr:RsmF rRNA methyltransferase first C-terminal domain-containing protein [Clostridia bacterium]
MKENTIDTKENFAFPEGFAERMQKMLGCDFEAFCAAYSKPRRAALRINPLKDTGNLKGKIAAQFSLSPVPWAKYGFYVDGAESSHPGLHPFHEAGAYYIQEASAMISVSLAPPRYGEKVLDLCAAPGGKSTQIAAFLGGEGLLVANEIHPARAAVLSSNIERMGIQNALVTNESPDKLAGRFIEFFDRIFVDAPCSGEGMFRKEEAALTQWSEDYLRVCADRQSSILDNAAKMLAPDGVLVYSTCTFAPEENECVIAEFLSRHSNFEIMDAEISHEGFLKGNPLWVNEFSTLDTTVEGLEKCVRLFPHRADAEGHFAAVLHRVGTPRKADVATKTKKDTKQKRQTPTVQWKKPFYEFARDCLSVDFTQKLDVRPAAIFGDNVYALPCTTDLDGLRVLRAGLHLGSVRGNRFEPSHALALAMLPTDAQRVYELSDKEAVAYIRGEAIAADAAKGWILLTYQGVSLGFGKVSDGLIKNHYPKGLRRNLA